MNPICSTIERLESRIAPAVLMQFGDFDGDGVAHDLKLSGGNGSERILIQDSSTGTSIAIDANGNGSFEDPSDTPLTPAGFSVQQFELNLKAGNDAVTVQMVGNYNTPKSFLVNLGPGNNEFHFLAGNNNINAGALRMDIVGGKNNDYLDIQFFNVVVPVDISARLGAGVDGKLTDGKITGPSQIVLAGLVGVAHMNADINLGPGSNRFLVNFNDGSYGIFGIPTPLDFRITGSNVPTDKDDVTVSLTTANLDTGAEIRVIALLGAGNDAFHAPIAGFLTYGNSQDTGANASVSFEVEGGPGNDLLEATRIGTPGSIQINGVLEYNFRGGDGNDTIKVDLGTNTASAQLTTTNENSVVQALRMRLDGGIGNDVITAIVSNTAAATFSYDLVLFGGDGNDRLAFSGTNNGGTPSYGPGFAAIVNGGLGNDLFNITAAGGFVVKQFNKDGTFS